MANVVIALANALLYPEDAQGRDPVAFVLDGYPHLSEQDVCDAIAYYEAHRAATRSDILDDEETRSRSTKRWGPSTPGSPSHRVAQVDASPAARAVGGGGTSRPQRGARLDRIAYRS